MWNPWKRAREARQAEQELRMAALGAIERVAVAQSEAYKALALALQDYFDSFKAQSTPRTWAATDLSEWQKEQEELMMAAGMPTNGSERDKLRWLADEMDS